MQNANRRDMSIPKPLLLGAFVLIIGTVIWTSYARITSDDQEKASVFAPVESRDLRFEDQPDGSVLVFDAVDDAKVATLEPGEGGFTRSILRGLVRERRLNKIGGKSAFRLQRMANGGLMLGDPATGREIHLAAFGTSNVAAFERLMAAGGETD